MLDEFVFNLLLYVFIYGHLVLSCFPLMVTFGLIVCTVFLLFLLNLLNLFFKTFCLSHAFGSQTLVQPQPPLEYSYMLEF